MALPAKEKSSSPVRLSVEFSPELHQAILHILEASQTPINADALLKTLEDHFSDALTTTIAEATGVATPFPQGVEVEIASDNDEEDETDEEILEGFRQAWKEAMEGKTHPASVLWDDSFWDAPDDE